MVDFSTCLYTYLEGSKSIIKRFVAIYSRLTSYILFLSPTIGKTDVLSGNDACSLLVDLGPCRVCIITLPSLLRSFVSMTHLAFSKRFACLDMINKS